MSSIIVPPASARFRVLFCAAALVFAASARLIAAEANSVEPAEQEESRDASGQVEEAPITPDDRLHWAFAPLKRPAMPSVEDVKAAPTTIDRFIHAKLEEEGLEPLPPASRQTLIRRATYDLTGLPPTPQQVDAFVRDTRPDAYERLIDRLLNSPAYGERWAQHWLDLARFAESDGFEHDKIRPKAWRYRDWVIDALNDDMPYDRFVQMQLAGDEIEPQSESAWVATGFLLCGPDMPDINLQQERRHNVLNELAGTVGSVFLGLQFQCAACHDHKYDPISQADFYRLRSFFETVDLFRDHPYGRVAVERTRRPKPAYLWIRGDFRRQGPQLQRAFPRIANPWDQEVPEPPDGSRTTEHRRALAEWLTRPDHPLATRVITNRLWQYHFGRGLVRTPSDFGLIGENPSHPKLLDWLATELPRQGWSLKRMHRLIMTSAAYRRASYATEADPAALDAWKASLEQDPENRLLARMNRRRLDGEQIRDALLFVSGQLSRRRGGRGIMAPLPDEVQSTLIRGHWQVDEDPVDHKRRSIYLFVRRNLQYPMFAVFDRPDTNASCPRRAHTTTAPQALTLLNSRLSLEASRHLAGRILEARVERLGEHADAASLEAATLAAPSTDAAFVEELFQRVLGRRPTEDEASGLLRFLQQQRARLAAENRGASTLALPSEVSGDADPYAAAAFVDACLALLNTNEFLYVD